jgi:RND family efflux transporter MFP subunit
MSRRAGCIASSWLAGLAVLCTAALAEAQTLPSRVLPQPAEAGIRGVTQCFRDLSLGFPISGRLSSVPVTEGSEVAVGAELASLELVAERLEVDRRRLQWENQAELRAATARAATAASQMNSAREIFRSNRGISREELENKELAHALAVAEVERIRNAKAIEHVDFLTAQENVARRILRAPSPGIVTKVIRNVGESVQINETAIRLCDLSKIVFTVNVPVAALTGLRVGETARVLVSLGAETVPAEGAITFISPVVDAASGLTEVKVELQPNLAAGIRPGLQARLVLGR